MEASVLTWASGRSRKKEPPVPLTPMQEAALMASKVDFLTRRERKLYTIAVYNAMMWGMRTKPKPSKPNMITGDYNS